MCVSKSVSDDVQFRVLRVLQDRPDLSQRQIAQELGVSLGAVNYCLRALAERGQVKIRNFRAAGNRLRYAYVLTPRGIAAKSRLASAFLRRKLAEYDALKAEIAQIEAELRDGKGG